MCVKCFLVLMYVYTVLFLCFSDCHVDINICIVIISVCVKCFNIDVRIYGTLLLFFLLLFLSSWLFCHFDIDVCIYITCTFLIVKRILMSIMYSAESYVNVYNAI